MSNKHRPAELQLAIMQVLWERGEGTVAEVREALRPERQLAYTTVGTMLAKMEDNGQVSHRTNGRVNVYRPALSRDKVTRTMVGDLTERLFRGDVTELVCHLLDGREMSREELAELKRLIRRKEQELRDDA